MMVFNFEKVCLTNLVLHIPHYVFWKDNRSVYMGCNIKFAKMAGLTSPEEIIGKTDKELPWSKGFSDVFLLEDQELIKNHQPLIDKEVDIIDSSGAKMVINISKVPLLDEKNNAIGVLGVYTDVTQQKQTEEELCQLNKRLEITNSAKNLFINATNKEIRTPLTNVVGLAEYLLSRAKDEEKHSLDMIKQSALNVKSALDKIMYFINLESVSIVPAKEVFSLRALLLDIISQQDKYLTQNSLEMKLLYPSITIESFVGDSDLIYQVLQTVISFMIKNNHGSSVEIEVKQLNRYLNKIDLSINIACEKTKETAVKDHLLKEVFSLNQLEPNVVSESGLQLSISKKILTLINGDISYKDLDKKLNVEIFLSLELPSNQSKLAVTGRYAPLGNTDLNPKKKKYNNYAEIKVLLIEDEPINRKVVGNMFSEILGCQIKLASTVSEALQYSVDDFDVVFTDIHLPDGTGIDFLDEVKEKYPSMLKAIYAVTVYVTEADRQEYIDAGFVDVLPKPITTDMLKSILDVVGD